MDCNHGGEIRGFLELHKAENGWTAIGYLCGKLTPEVVVQVNDPGTALSEASWHLANEAAMVDELREEG